MSTATTWDDALRAAAADLQQHPDISAVARTLPLVWRAVTTAEATTVDAIHFWTRIAETLIDVRDLVFVDRTGVPTVALTRGDGQVFDSTGLRGRMTTLLVAMATALRAGQEGSGGTAADLLEQQLAAP